ncbi:MAG TPA: pitrilysin family protein [Dehalococcoidales bacterium]|nr:pitrilysin family protein [Dehalococcoidales bacterium]
MYQKTILPNGMRVLSSSMPHTRSVCIAIFIGVGSRYETDSEAGTAHYIEHLLFRGTHRRPIARDISEAIEGIGGILNGATDKELTFIWCKVTREHLADAAGVLADMLLNSLFRPEDIEKERQVIIEEIHMGKDTPSQQAGLLIDGLLWPQHPLGRDIAGTVESVTAIQRSQMLNFFTSKYTPRNTLIAITGNVAHNEVVELVNGLAGNWQNNNPSPPYLPYCMRTGERLKIEKRETEQAHLCLALPGIGLAHPQRFHLDLLNVILGEGMSSRLFCEIRDKMGLAYSINSFVEHYLDSGSLTVAASVDPDNLNAAIQAILDQLEMLKSDIPESELQKAREISKGRLLLRMEDSRNVAGWMGGQEMLMGNILTLDEVVSIIDSVTISDMQAIARELVAPAKARLAVVGPITNPQPLEKLLRL